MFIYFFQDNQFAEEIMLESLSQQIVWVVIGLNDWIEGQSVPIFYLISKLSLRIKAIYDKIILLKMGQASSFW